MIFNCPGCDAGHTVPLSMIPTGGLDMACRRCGVAFVAHADGEAEARGKNLGAAPVVLDDDDGENTSLEPSSDLVASGETTEGPTPAFDDDAEATVEAMSDLDPPTQDLDPTQRLPSDIASAPRVRAVPLSKAGASLPADPADIRATSRQGPPPVPDPSSAEHDAFSEPTGRDVEPLSPPPGPADKTPLVEVDGPELASSDPDLASPSSVYDLVASGNYTPPPQPTEPPDDEDGPKSWNEPSSPDLRRHGPLGRFAVWLDRAPLGVKVGLLVFPVALGVTLLLTASGGDEDETPIQIPTQAPAKVAQDPAPQPALTAPVRRAPTEPTAAAPPPAAVPSPARAPEPALESPRPVPREGGLPADRAAPEGYAYTQRTLRVRAKASLDARAGARLRRGRLVREYETRGDWVLILREPDGPAGFVSTADLGPRPPLSVLAASVAFERCAARKRSERAYCLDYAAEQLEACNASCGATDAANPDDPGARCEAACRMAFDKCKRGCARKRRRPTQ